MKPQKLRNIRPSKLGFLFLGVCLPFVLSCRSESSQAESNQAEKKVAHIEKATRSKSLSELLPSDYASSKVSLYIDKEGYYLTVLYENKPIKSYPVVFGFGYGPDKRREGDGATPEGSFKVQDLYPHPHWSKFIWLDYPTAQSWKKFKKAKANGSIPQNSSIGGEIGIHGVPNYNEKRIANKNNWTAGCISLTNSDVNEIYKVLKKGTVVNIR